MAKIDIVVPCYNYGRFLQACVSSVLDQSVPDLRVLIIDDSSTDCTLAVASELAEADARVSVISHSQNWGHIRTYNQGIEWAFADYFMLLSADDLLVPGALERSLFVLEEFPEVVLAFGDWIEWDGSLPVPDAGKQRDCRWIRQDGLDFINAGCAHAGNPVRTPTVVTRTHVQKSVGGYSSHLTHSGDMEMWLRFAANGSVARTDAVQAIYRQHSSNMSSSYCFDDYEQRKDAFESFFAEYSDRLPGSEMMRERAMRTLAERAFWTGTAQLCRGNATSGRRLLGFAITLCPHLRYRPPLRRMAQTADLHKVLRVFRDSCGNISRWAGPGLGVLGAHQRTVPADSSIGSVNPADRIDTSKKSNPASSELE